MTKSRHFFQDTWYNVISMNKRKLGGHFVKKKLLLTKQDHYKRYRYNAFIKIIELQLYTVKCTICKIKANQIEYVRIRNINL